MKSEAQINEDICTFFDGIYRFSKERDDEIYLFYQMMKEIYENENKEIFIFVSSSTLRI